MNQLRTVVAGAALLIASVAVGIAQSPNPFGLPSADKPQPGAGIAAAANFPLTAEAPISAAPASRFRREKFMCGTPINVA